MGELVAANVGKKIIVRTAASAITGVGSKALNEVKDCATRVKKWSQFGKNLDDKGNEKSVKNSVASWLLSAGVGAVGGVAAHGSSGLSNCFKNPLAQVGIRTGSSAISSGTCNVIQQGVNIQLGNQEEFKHDQLIGCVISSAATTAAFEATKGTIYHLNEGKEQYLIKKSNEDAINKIENISNSDKIKLKEDLNTFKNKVPDSQARKTVGSHPVKDAGNGHFLTGARANKIDRSNQVAFDVGSNGLSRGVQRAVFDFDTDSNGKALYKFSAYLPNHDYKNAPSFGSNNMHHNNVILHDMNIQSTPNIINNVCQIIVEETEEETAENLMNQQ